MRPMRPGQIVAYSMGALGASIVTNLSSAAFPLLLSTYALATWQILLLAQERSLVGAIVQPLVGIASDRFPRRPFGRRRPFMLVGAPVTAATLLILSTHPSRLVAIVTITLMAVFLAVASDPYYALLADLAPSQQRGRIGGVMAIFQMVGQAFAVVVSALWWETNQTLVFAIDAAVLVGSFLITIALVPEPTASTEPAETRLDQPATAGPAEVGVDQPAPTEPAETRLDRPEPAVLAEAGVDRPATAGSAEAHIDPPAPAVLAPTAAAPLDASTPPKQSARAYLRDLAGRPELAKYLAATFCYWFGLGGVLPAVTLFGIRELHTTETEAFVLFLPALVGVALVAYPAGLLAERFTKKPVLVVGMGLFATASLIGSYLATSFVEGLVVMFAIGVANGVAAALAFPLLTDLIPRERAGEFTGIGSTVWSIAQPIGVLALGLLADAGGSIRPAFYGAGAAFVLATILLLTVHPERAAGAQPGR